MKFGSKKVLLGIQHVFAMFGATILVPAQTGLNPSVALITAGLGTLLFHLITGRKVPVFLGSSFAFIAVIKTIVDTKGIPYAQGGIIAAGCIYLLLSLITRLVGTDRIKSLFPPIVTGPVIMVIGLNLSPTALSMASANWGLAIFVLAIVILVSVFTKGFFKLVPILIGIFCGYIAALCFNLVDLAPIAQASWISPFWATDGSFFTLPKFDWEAILLIAPVAFVSFMEHIGDITTNGSVVGQDFLKDPGLHRTVLGDGAATILAGLLGGPANTTYSENTGVLAVTKVYDPSVIRLAAVFAIILGLFGKFGAILMNLPTAIMGGVCILLFGMIASIGIRTLAEANLDFAHSRNLIVVALILVVGLGLSSGVQIGTVSISGLFLAVLVGAVVNKVLPEPKGQEE